MLSVSYLGMLSLLVSVRTNWHRIISSCFKQSSFVIKNGRKKLHDLIISSSIGLEKLSFIRNHQPNVLTQVFRRPVEPWKKISMHLCGARLSKQNKNRWNAMWRNGLERLYWTSTLRYRRPARHWRCCHLSDSPAVWQLHLFLRRRRHTWRILSVHRSCRRDP